LITSGGPQVLKKKREKGVAKEVQEGVKFVEL